ncbi:Uncharacterized protein OBRU01_25283, partial [Operophtera brumata]
MFKTPLLILLLLGTTSCENDSDSDITETPINENHARHRHSHSILTNGSDGNKLSEIRYLRRHLNKEVLNFVMTDYLVDGEVENRVHYNGISAKETYCLIERWVNKTSTLAPYIHYNDVMAPYLSKEQRNG